MGKKESSKVACIKLQKDPPQNLVCGTSWEWGMLIFFYVWFCLKQVPSRVIPEKNGTVWLSHKCRQLLLPNFITDVNGPADIQ